MAPNHKLEDTESGLGKDMRKLRKPVIEKMRRDRINSSIEQLRLLLEKEFQRHQLPSKPEKADILEMTVNLLRQQLHHATKGELSNPHLPGYTILLVIGYTYARAPLPVWSSDH
ncbi:transcription factor HES-5-like [Hyla sarda]|uniref:transcription factor HES-5-like n=1 Tax=Hyla sarda TaxID=327740 RepID=UPI0024C28CA2|nr:transcription factor HES-5-like [Hyla sarda]